MLSAWRMRRRSARPRACERCAGAATTQSSCAGCSRSKWIRADPRGAWGRRCGQTLRVARSCFQALRWRFHTLLWCDLLVADARELAMMSGRRKKTPSTVSEAM